MACIKLIFFMIKIPHTQPIPPTMSPKATATLTDILNKDIFSIVRSFQRKSYWMQSCSKEPIFWKNRFTHDVLPLINKGYRLVCIINYNGKEIPCANCYHYGICADFAGDNDDHWGNISSRRHVSYEEFRRHSNIRVWTQEQYLALPKTLYGRYTMNKFRDAPHPLMLQIRKSKLFRSIQAQKADVSRNTILEETISDLNSLFMNM